MTTNFFGDVMGDLPALQACLFDTGGVLYHRPREDQHLRAFLEAHGLKLRHRAVLQKALRAARFDARTGRISRETLYDAILRMNGLEDRALFPTGREALYRDAADIELFPGVIETLERLRGAGLKLGTVSNTAHTASEKVAWLAARGLAPELWDVFLASSDEGMTKAHPAIFTRALDTLGVAAGTCGYVAHATGELRTAQEVGLVTIAFLPDDYAVEADYHAGSFYELGDRILEARESPR